MTEITHGYQKMGSQYDSARSGTAGFAEFMIENADLVTDGSLVKIAEFGIGGGQQTPLVTEELHQSGVLNFVILGYDKSFDPSPKGDDQLNVLRRKIDEGEISNNVIPSPYDIDGNVLPLAS